MRRRSTDFIFTICGALLCFGAASSSVQAADSSGDEISVQVLSGLKRYCFECHGDTKAKKDLRLDQFTTVESVLAEKRLWSRVLAHVRDEQMPPDDADTQPSERERGALVGDIEQMLDVVDWDRYRRAGREMIARLTRLEYRYTMRDLLGLDLHSDEGFAEDGEGESGFRNDRASLMMGAAQVEKYLDAAERAVDGVMALAFLPLSKRGIYSAEKMERSMVDRMKPHEGGMVLANPGQELSAEFDFPADGYYRVALRAAIMGKATVALVRVDGLVVTEVAISGTANMRLKEEGLMFVRKGRHRFSIENKNLFPHKRQLPLNAADLVVREAKRNRPRLEPFASESEKLRDERIAFNQQSWGAQEPYEWLKLLGVEGDSREIDRFRKYAQQRGAALARERNKLAGLAGIKTADLELIWQKQNQLRLADNASLLERVAKIEWRDWMQYQGKIHLKSMVIEGPVFPGEKKPEGARRDNTNLLEMLKKWDRSDDSSIKVLKSFLPLAFRREVDGSEQSRYDKLYQGIRARGEEPLNALRLTLTAILTTPEFLFREENSEATDEEEVEGLGSWTMASRLSYFLWSTMPDDKLRQLAESGSLKEGEALRQQADRLLEDERAKVFFKSFAGQWLGIDSLGKSVVPDARRFPEFTPELGEMMKEETMKYIESIFIEDRPLIELLDSKWAFLNERLAQHYGIDGVRGAELQRVDLDDRRRGGLLGMGSVLTVSSSPARTNPMRRGFWVLEGLLGDQLGEPPGDAGELPGDAGEARGKTLREEVELHRTRKSCMSCHVKLDPIGFGLQNFDALGRWRDDEAGKPVDSSGVMPDGTRFNGPVELKQVLLERKDEFVKNLCARMLSYALVRKLEYYDEAEVRR
ncbi:MAG: DUF1592 domain-containing protein, partial [Verrucomicrobia bacterium]|nr:DUF1592 domain-containing protein [Verrucomicrobiota bacterium]